jgi:hypothetical protein
MKGNRLASLLFSIFKSKLTAKLRIRQVIRVVPILGASNLLTVGRIRLRDGHAAGYWCRSGFGVQPKQARGGL